MRLSKTRQSELAARTRALQAKRDEKMFEQFLRTLDDAPRELHAPMVALMLRKRAVILGDAPEASMPTPAEEQQAHDDRLRRFAAYFASIGRTDAWQWAVAAGWPLAWVATAIPAPASPIVERALARLLTDPHTEG
jgi:hypothetical protein